ncbi:LytTR family transcriptional regulator [Polaribacter sp. WD7]|uniref:LytTR family DNA-binding domain-containing protein n=1 Tax=Polaribacter sp. WD7 TaxID=2269061 RepID=UPI000DF374CC|nr:LytTR family DNA-binding domain-containing protein [Polaribacter sp. WD7]RCS26078.1 LytTR family transcriptional regulator [Polaribacter sp. WD7]
MKKKNSWLSKPYYFNTSIKFKLKISFFFGLFVFCFLYIFKPFYLSLIDHPVILEYTIGIGIIVFIGTFFMVWVPPMIFKRFFNEDKWTIGRNILLLLVGVLIVGTFLWYFGEMYKEQYNLKKLSLLQYLIYSFLVTCLPLSIYIFYNEKYTRERRQEKIGFIKKYKSSITLEKKQILNDFIKIYSDNKKEYLEFKADDLVYITSQGNYASFFLKKQNSINLKEDILRVTLSKIDTNLKEYPNIIRCHKSYIINSNYIEDIQGNARGYLLKIKHVCFFIPVSRNFSKQSLLIFSR